MNSTELGIKESNIKFAFNVGIGGVGAEGKLFKLFMETRKQIRDNISNIDNEKEIKINS